MRIGPMDRSRYCLDLMVQIGVLWAEREYRLLVDRLVLLGLLRGQVLVRIGSSSISGRLLIEELLVVIRIHS